MLLPADQRPHLEVVRLSEYEYRQCRLEWSGRMQYSSQPVPFVLLKSIILYDIST